MRKQSAFILIVLVTILLISGTVWYFVVQQDADGAKVLEIAKAQKGSVAVQLQSTGIIQAQVGAIVKTGTRATGVIERMLVRVGDRVEKGILIAKIDDREQRANYVAQEAALRQAQAQLENVNKTYPIQIDQAQATLDGSLAQRRFTYLTWQRRIALVATGVLEQSSLDEAYQDYVVAATQAKSNKDALRLLEENYITDVINAVEAVVSAQAELDNASIQISYTEIYAPIDGLVSQVTAQEGETVVAGLQVANLITILDPTRLEMLIYVDETDVGTVTRGMPVNFTVDAYPSVIFRGSVSKIYPEAVIQDNIVYYQALVPLKPKTAIQLRPQMTTQCSIITKEIDSVLVVPNNAIKWVDGKQYVYIVDENNRATPVSPEFGTMGANNTEVLSGINNGDLVATRLILPSNQSKE
ncbi:efflux RND transporter periplasmic adaptor subunit [Halodesulfovibrio sp.]|jgi:multidrug efflux pump subunit AcrA (membrane-fusion protein)|uniref:efflux RND transporter periplasmic adaptor subunit n=1 Tax=Halodesulfovibrio sp. TaxID=1912772 RepID=UPI0025E4A6CD|nr:efflux RND transporter periplasmic adaptor subunit [Halodesulfovibrio sp.]MCT4535507.1 efflux RND transporter periplasmic adaptor subunit [Halodesulfovibrio sp.]MCT4626321.1 efflux RND transporter periplasmic adaptor subunit [Halodesulfovibrio sp.]